MPFGVNPKTCRPGPSPKEARDGDRVQARHRVNMEVRCGAIPHPNAVPCADCWHIWREGERRHEYDHYLGYAAENHLVVQSVCTGCHAKRDSAKAKQTECVHGHKFTPENTMFKPNGTRQCRECRRNRDRNRRDAAYWREYRKKKKAS